MLYSFFLFLDSAVLTFFSTVDAVPELGLAEDLLMAISMADHLVDQVGMAAASREKEVVMMIGIQSGCVIEFFDHSGLTKGQTICACMLIVEAPGHLSLEMPQNVAWLSAIVFAQDTIFIQTPDLNAESLLHPLLAAVKRGVTVTLVLCLGYNDLGEMLPFQGGHNETVIMEMKKQILIIQDDVSQENTQSACMRHWADD